MADQRYAVSIGFGENVNQYSEAYQTQPGYALQWKGVLQKAHRVGLVRCLCPGKGTRRLAVRHRSDSDSFHLSRYPHTGAEHALDCLYYSPDPDKSGLGGYSKGVVEETKDGDLKVKLTLSLRKKDPVDVQPMEGTSPTLSGGKPTKPAMTLGGLLHLLWSEAGLNQWVPGMAGKRGLGLIHSRLQQAADRMLASRMRIGDALVIASSSADSQQANANSQKVASAIRNNRRLIVIAPLAAYSEEREQTMSRYITITGYHGVPRLFTDTDTWQRIARSYAAELRGWREGRRVIAIVQTDQPTGPGKAQALNVALMVVSDEWIPVESGYEAKIEALLREQGRRFIKPMRFDAGQEQVFPDFWLMDVGAGRELPMEVYGRQDPKYLARKQAKSAYYTQHYGPTGWWSWDASADPKGQSIPPFPPTPQTPGHDSH
ncbi:DUF1173 family protein [Pseudomonas putida]|uniref:DUF1173 family protein n=1 Tax=Pseudomonas putida TaxID=303 RepID=UPI003523343E